MSDLAVDVDAEAWRAVPLADSSLSTRARAVLAGFEVSTFGELADADADAIRDADRCGRQTYGEIVDALAGVMGGGPARRVKTMAELAREKLEAAKAAADAPGEVAEAA